MDRIWYQIEIDDKEFLKGKIFIKIINLLSEYIKHTKVFTNDIVGAGILKIEYEMSISETLSALEDVQQLDWGDLFFVDIDTPFTILGKPLYSELIQNAVLTIRAIDDQYVNIFTKNEKIKKILEKNFKEVKIIKGGVQDLKFYS